MERVASEGPMNGQSKEWLAREMYAGFGLAYYFSECLHRGLCVVYALAPFHEKEAILGLRLQERMAEAFLLTLGQLVQALDPWAPNLLKEHLAESVCRRNLLAHRFWYDRAHLMHTADGLQELIDELAAHRRFFDAVDAEIEDHFSEQRRHLGVTDDAMLAAFRDVLAKVDQTEPPHEQRRLGKSERLVRIWDVPVVGRGSTLIFELDDQTLWQLTDVGLGWSRFVEPAADWSHNAVLSPFLPCSIDPRPGSPGAWKYQIRLAKGATIDIRLSDRKKSSFEWRLQLSQRSRRREKD